MTFLLRRFVFLALATLGLAAGVRADTGTFEINPYIDSKSEAKKTYTVQSTSKVKEARYGYDVSSVAIKAISGGSCNWTVSGNSVEFTSFVFSGGWCRVNLIWTPWSYTLNYDPNGGALATGVPSQIVKKFKETVQTPTTGSCSRAGHTLASWNTAKNGSGVQVGLGSTLTMGTPPMSNDTRTVTLYAQWQANTYNVQLVAADADPGSGHASDITVTYDQTPATIAKLPTRQYWKFDGYYTQQNGSGVKYFDADGNATRKWQVTDVAILYANWVRYKCTVTFLKEGPGSVNLGGSHLYDSGDVVSAKAMPDNYAVFLRWSDGEATESHSDIVVVSNATYTAYFVAKVYSLTFRYTNTKRVLVTVVQQYEHGAAVIPPDDVKPETGYSWEWNPTPPATAYQNDEFGGQYVANHYEIRFDGNGADSGSMDAIDAEYDSEDTLPPNAFVRNGYSFRGWNRNPAATEAEFSDGATVSNLSTIKNDTVTLYAIWAPNSYTVRYDGNGATGGSMADQSFTYDEAQALTANGFTRAGQKFLHWNDAAGHRVYGNGEVVSNLTTVADGSVTLSAVWSNYHYVRFDRNDATNKTEMALQTFSGAEVTNLYPNVYGKVGYTFAGWATNLVDAASCRVTYTNCQAVSFPQAKAGETNVLYATWSTNRYTIIFDPGNAPTDTTHYFFGKMDPLTNCLYDAAVTIKCGWTNYCSQGLKGWSKTQGAEEADYPVRTTSPLTQGSDAIVSNLTDTADGTVKLYAVWADVGDLSKAAGLNNAVLFNDDPLKPDWVDSADKGSCGGSCVATEVTDDGTHYLSVKVICPGTLRFSWRHRGTKGQRYFRLWDGSDFIDISKIPDGEWHTNSLFITGSGEHTLKFYTDLNSCTMIDVRLEDITWTPEADEVLVDPTNPPKYATKEEAEAAAMKARVVPPNAEVAAVVTPADYDAMFAKPLRVVQAAEGQWTLACSFTEGVSNDLQAVLNAAASNLVDAAGRHVYGEGPFSVSLMMTNGLYYGLAASDAIGAISTLWPTNWVLGEGVVQELKVDRPSEDMGFFRLRVGVTTKEP